MSEIDTWRGPQDPFNEDVKRLRERLAFALGDGGFSAEQIGGEF